MNFKMGSCSYFVTTTTLNQLKLKKGKFNSSLHKKQETINKKQETRNNKQETSEILILFLSNIPCVCVAPPLFIMVASQPVLLMQKVTFN